MGAGGKRVAAIENVAVEEDREDHGGARIGIDGARKVSELAVEVGWGLGDGDA